MKKIHKNYWLVCLMFLGFLSCNNDDGEKLFSDTPSDRIEQRTSELLELLLSQPQGYKGVYFSKNDEFGGFTFYMKFNANGTVEMTSDVDSETAIITSSYEVRFGTTTELVFTTRNHIQKLSETNSGNTAGFRGTSVFQYFSNDNGVITFRDVRNRNTASLILEPAGFSNFTSESVAKAEASLLQRENLLPTAASSVFQILRIQNGNGTSNFNLNYNPEDLFASPKITFDDGSVTEFNFGIAFTESGLIISPALEFEGETYTNFTYDAATSSYISTVNGTTATLLFGNEPAFIGRDIENLVNVGPNGFLYRPSLGSNPLTSQGFNNLMAQVQAGLEAQGFRLTEFQFVFNFESDDCDNFLYIRVVRISSGQAFTAFYCYDKAVIQDRKLFQNYTGPFGGAASNGGFFENSMAPLINFFGSNNGMIFTEEGGFSSSLFNYSNLAGTFTSLDDPSLRVYGLFF